MGVSDRDRRHFKRIGEWKATLAPLSPPPPRTFDQVYEVHRIMQRGLSPLPLHGDDEAAVARLTEFRRRLLGKGATTGEERLDARVGLIYDEVNRLADEIGGVERGLNVLYGPPLVNPDLMIVSVQGGGADGIRQHTWPSRLSYLDSPFPFGGRLRKDFQDADLWDVLSSRTVASNIVFPQWPAFSEWKKQPSADAWRKRCGEWLDRLVQAMAPKAILTYGKEPFEQLTGGRKSRGLVATGRRGNVPVVGCGHLMRGTSLRERREALAALRRMIRCDGDGDGDGSG